METIDLVSWAGEDFTRKQAVILINQVMNTGTIRGVRGSKVDNWPISLQQLADYGVPPNHDLPYDSDILRALVQELAQLIVD